MILKFMGPHGNFMISSWQDYDNAMVVLSQDHGTTAFYEPLKMTPQTQLNKHHPNTTAQIKHHNMGTTNTTHQMNAT